MGMPSRGCLLGKSILNDVRLTPNDDMMVPLRAMTVCLSAKFRCAARRHGYIRTKGAP